MCGLVRERSTSRPPLGCTRRSPQVLTLPRSPVCTSVNHADYISIPQPLAEQAKKSMSALTVEDADETEPEGLALASTGGAVAHAGMMIGAQAHAGLIAADHRQSVTTDDSNIAKLAAQLRAAVDSIPQYVERCTMMWVLVPPVAHADVEGVVCDFNSWRSRGWCRLEYAASNLARHDMPVLVVRDPSKPPEYFSPCDAMKVPAAKGNFTVSEDRDKVSTPTSPSDHPDRSAPPPLLLPPRRPAHLHSCDTERARPLLLPPCPSRRTT